MKKIVFVIAVQLSHFLCAAAPAAVAQQESGSDYISLSDQDPLLKFAYSMQSNFYELPDLKTDYINCKTSDVSTFTSSSVICKNKLLAEMQTQNLSDEMQTRAIALFEGMTRRCFASYRDVLQKWQEITEQVQKVVLKDFAQVNDCIFLPDPFGTFPLAKGKEQEACDLVKELLNLDARYKKERALLFGVRTINARRLMIYLTGCKQIKLPNEEINAEECVQNLYAAYSSPNFDMQRIYELEALAASHLLRDNERVTLTHYDSLTYDPSSSQSYRPNAVNREENLNKAAMLEIIKKNAETALTVEQQNNIKQRMDFLAAMMNFAKEKAKHQAGFIDRETQARAALITAEDAQSKEMFASFSPSIERIKADLAAAAVVSLQARNALLTQENNQKWKNIEQKINEIQENIKRTGRTLAGYTAAELIMDYGSEYNSSITREDRTNTESVLDNQFAIRGITDYKCEGKIMSDVAVTLFKWFQGQNLDKSADEMSTASFVLNEMAKTVPADIASNTHLQFLAAIYKLYRLSEFYQQWPVIAERVKFLEQLKTTIYQAFEQVIQHKGAQNPLRCLTGARGRAFLLNLSIISCMRDQHQ